MTSAPLTGSFRILFLYDVGEEIRMEQLRNLIGGQRYGDGAERRRDPAFHRPSPEYVRFERPPVIEQLGPMVFKNGGRFNAEVNYYEYGAVSVKLGLPFELDWPELVALSTSGSQTRSSKRKPSRSCVDAWKKPALHWCGRIRSGLPRTTTSSICTMTPDRAARAGSERPI